MNTYALLKLVHVVAVITSLGGALTMSLLTWRIVRAGDGSAASRRVGRPNAVYLVLLGSVVAAMVLKPTL